MEEYEIRPGYLAIRALKHKLRLKIIDLIESNDRLTVTDIYTTLRIDQSVASQHLAILRRANILSATRESKNIYYSVNHDVLEGMKKFIAYTESVQQNT